MRLVLEGTRSNRSGIGAELVARVGGRVLRRRVRSGSSYLCASELATKVDRRVPLQSGSDEEIEIRALSVVAVDELVARLRNRGLDWDAARVDGQLWWRGQTRRERDRPYHRTRTIWY